MDDVDAAQDALLVDRPHTDRTQPFMIDDERRANWLVRKITELRSYRDRVATWAASESARSLQSESWLLRRFGPELEAWVQAQLALSGERRRFVSLPAGRAGFRRVKSLLVVDDPTVTIEWAAVNCTEAVVRKPSLSKTTLNEHFSNTGEIPPGSHVEPEDDRFYIA